MFFNIDNILLISFYLFAANLWWNLFKRKGWIYDPDFQYTCGKQNILYDFQKIEKLIMICYFSLQNVWKTSWVFNFLDQCCQWKIVDFNANCTGSVLCGNELFATVTQGIFISYVALHFGAEVHCMYTCSLDFGITCNSHLRSGKSIVAIYNFLF